MLKRGASKSGLICLMLVVCWVWSVSGALAQEWQEYQSAHFTVRYHPIIPNKYVREFTRQCESARQLIAERLGLRRADFWPEASKTRIFIYSDRRAYLEDTNSSGAEDAQALIHKQIIRTFYFEKDFLTTSLPHRLSQIILSGLIDQKAPLPQWFEQGLACANEKASLTKYFLPVKGLVDREIALSVADMERLSSAGIAASTVFKATAAALVIFLLEDYGEQAFFQLCQQLHQGQTFYAAMDKVYAIQDAAALHAKFVDFVNHKSLEDIVRHQRFNLNW